MLLRKFAEKVLDIDDTVKPEGHLRLLEDYSSRFKFNEAPKDVTHFLGLLKKKHLVDEIVVSTLHGSSIASTNGDAISQAVSGAAMFNYIKSELPKSETVMVRSNGVWHMLFHWNKRIYIVRATANLSTVELAALAREIEYFISEDTN